MSEIKDDDIQSKPSVGRRGFVYTIGVAFVGATSLVTGMKRARAADGGGRNAKDHSGCTDSDGGSTADPVGDGDRCASTRSCDADVGCFADPC